MKALKWVMRRAVAIDQEPKKHGHLAVIGLECGHVVTWKWSRLKSYKPIRWRCAQCQELLEEFLTGVRVCELVGRMEKQENDKPVIERAASGTHAGGCRNLPGRGVASILRRFMRGD